MFNHEKTYSYLAVPAILLLPLYGFSQTWSKEEQAFLDHVTNIWLGFANQPLSWEQWKANVLPDDNQCWWWTDQGMPNDLNATKTWHHNSEKLGLRYNHSHIRPIKINIVGDVAMIWFYSYISQTDNTGKITEWEDKRLEIFRRDGAGWKFLGGMVDAVDKE